MRQSAAFGILEESLNNGQDSDSVTSSQLGIFSHDAWLSTCLVVQLSAGQFILISTFPQAPRLVLQGEDREDAGIALGTRSFRASGGRKMNSYHCLFLSFCQTDVGYIN